MKKQSIKIKIIRISILIGVIWFFATIYAITTGLTHIQTSLMNNSLNSDILHIRKTIGEGDWIKDGESLYLGDQFLGDCTVENASIEPFIEFENSTGTFSYVFVKCSDKGLKWTGLEKNRYKQGHFRRVAGSTLGPNGESIVGTYMDKKVADVLDTDGRYQGPANVSGRQIYCVYETLLDKDNNVVGAIVVGRSVKELHDQIESSTVKCVILTLIAIAVASFLFIITVLPWLNSINEIEHHLSTISNGVLPKVPLKKRSNDEMGMLTDSINEMIDSLREKEELRKKASTDPLTGLLNRGSLDDEANKFFQKTDPQCALFILDLDNFKEVNDNLGHPVGDSLLIDIAKELKDIFRNEDIVARLGGDEFVCFAKGFTDHELLTKRAEALVKRLRREYIDPNGNKIIITASIGIALAPKDATDYKNLYRCADKALYAAKQKGKDNYIFY